MAGRPGRSSADVFTGLAIAKIIIAPNNRNLLYVAASRSGVEGIASPSAASSAPSTAGRPGNHSSAARTVSAPPIW
ncbi:MAG: hypothetical protein R2856_22740 [Caldilineaceae bacterium]